jgi:hypothetical protein
MGLKTFSGKSRPAYQAVQRLICQFHPRNPNMSAVQPSNSKSLKTKRNYTMKKRMTPSICFAAGMLMMGTIILSACSKNEDTTPATVTEEEAAEVVTDAVSGNSGGIAVQATDATSMATMYSATSCGMSKDTAIARSNISGAMVTYNATAQWHWTLSCVPARFDYSFAGAVIYDAPRMSSNDSLSSTLSITGLEATSTQYLLSMSSTRKGSQVSKILRKNTFTSTITFTATDLAVDKSTNIILSGTASVNISGASSSGRSFQYAGTVVFTGSKTATLTLGSGVTYNIQW